jgi:hypothetical protein
MAKLGNFELIASADVKAGEKTSVASLFSLPERSKEYELMQDVTEGTKLKITVDKLQPFESTADASIRKGVRVTSWGLIRYADFVREIVCSEDIRAGDRLKVTYETAEVP